MRYDALRGWPLTLFSPESHEPLTGTAWDAPRVRSAIAGVVAGVEAAFEDGVAGTSG